MAFSCADLSCYYALEETSTSGTRVDEKGTSDLTPVNSAGGAAAIIGNGATFSGTHYLLSASTAALTWNGNVHFSVAFWMYLPSSATQALLWKGDNPATLADYEWRVQTNGNKIRFAVTDNATHQGVLDTTATWSTSTWTFIAAWYDGTNLSCSINGGTAATLGYTFGSWNGGHHFTVGVTLTGASTGNILANGSMMDEISIWNGYAFTTGDVATLYNSGAGYGYASICPAGGNGLLLGGQRNRLVRAA